MAILHEATLTPTKYELIGPWLESRPWYDGIAERGPVGAFRLDDPDGQVGIEGFLYGSTAGSTLFVPVTYRGAALPAAEPHLIGTMEHSVLGSRWVYDACADPVFVRVLADTIGTGGRQADQELHRRDGSTVPRESDTTVRGSGGSGSVPPVGALDVTDEVDRTVIRSGDLELTVVRRVGVLPDSSRVLTAGFAGGQGLVIAALG